MHIHCLQSFQIPREQGGSSPLLAPSAWHRAWHTGRAQSTLGMTETGARLRPWVHNARSLSSVNERPRLAGAFYSADERTGVPSGRTLGPRSADQHGPSRDWNRVFLQPVGSLSPGHRTAWDVSASLRPTPTRWLCRDAFPPPGWGPAMPSHSVGGVGPLRQTEGPTRPRGHRGPTAAPAPRQSG